MRQSQTRPWVVERTRAARRRRTRRTRSNVGTVGRRRPLAPGDAWFERRVVRQTRRPTTRHAGPAPSVTRRLAVDRLACLRTPWCTLARPLPPLAVVAASSRGTRWDPSPSGPTQPRRWSRWTWPTRGSVPPSTSPQTMPFTWARCRASSSPSPPPQTPPLTSRLPCVCASSPPGLRLPRGRSACPRASQPPCWLPDRPLSRSARTPTCSASTLPRVSPLPSCRSPRRSSPSQPRATFCSSAASRRRPTAQPLARSATPCPLPCGTCRPVPHSSRRPRSSSHHERCSPGPGSPERLASCRRSSPRLAASLLLPLALVAPGSRCTLWPTLAQGEASCGPSASSTIACTVLPCPPVLTWRPLSRRLHPSHP